MRFLRRRSDAVQTEAARPGAGASSSVAALPARRLSLAKRLAFLVVADLLALGLIAVVAEVTLRLASPQTRYDSLPGWIMNMLEFSDDIYLGWQLRAGQLDHNAAGYRGPERPAAKPPGVWRILALGDSVTYGMDVKAGEAFAGQLEAKLNAAGAGPAEVLNFGVPGYNSFQEYELLKTRGLALDPDLVVMTFTADDVETSPVIINVGGEYSLFRNQFEGIGALNNLVHWAVFRHSHLYRFLYKYAALAVAAKGARFDDVYVHPRSQWKNVLLVADLCRQRRIGFLLVLSPWLLPHYQAPAGDPDAMDVREFHRYQEAMDEIRRFAREDRIDVLDLGPLYEKYTGKLKNRPCDHMHPNPLGHRLIAEQLVEKLLPMRTRQ